MVDKQINYQHRKYVEVIVNYNFLTIAYDKLHYASINFVVDRNV